MFLLINYIQILIYEKSPKFVQTLSQNLGSAFGSSGKLAGGTAVALYRSNSNNNFCRIAG